MSFNLGDWASQLQCDMCTGGDPPLDLNLPPDYLDGQIGDNFWDVPPEPADPYDLNFDLPDFYPTLEFTGGGIIIGIHGTF